VPADGGDEVAAVASAFNRMAGELAARADALAASDRARRQLLADVSHELNTPVTAMRGYLETLTMPELAIDDPTRARYLGIIGDETSRLERLIGDLLDLARLEGGSGGTFAPGEVAVAPLFERVIARHEQAARQSGVTIATVIEPGAVTLRGDAARLEQALQNLAANALRYAPRNSTIELAARRTGDTIAITMTDAGPGISAEHLPHLFDRFYKAEDARSTAPAIPSTAKGSGLGLSIVKAIVERHGGRVEVTSEPGRTVFRLILPA
jgi:two-component system sensor histidine kinase BaeS